MVYGICYILVSSKLATEFENPWRKTAATYGSMCYWGKELGWRDLWSKPREELLRWLKAYQRGGGRSRVLAAQGNVIQK